MGADVADHPGTGPRPVVAPREGNVPTAEEVRVEGAAVVPHGADPPFRDQFSSEALDGILDVVEPHHGRDPRLLGGRRHLERSVRVVGERLLAVDVLAGRDGCHRDLEVQVVRGGDVDDVDRRVLDHLAPVARVPPEPELGGGAGRDRLVRIRHDFQHRLRGVPPEGEPRRPVGHGVGLAHPPGADETDLEFRHAPAPSEVRRRPPPRDGRPGPGIIESRRPFGNALPGGGPEKAAGSLRPFLSPHSHTLDGRKCMAPCPHKPHEAIYFVKLFRAGGEATVHVTRGNNAFPDREDPYRSLAPIRVRPA